MKRITTFLYVLMFSSTILLVACGGEDNAGDEPMQFSAGPDVEGAEGTASVSLDWAGTYEGVTPCADCQGIKTSLVLTPEKEYQLTVVYLGKGDGKPATVKGSWIWKTGNIVELTGENFGADQFFISEGQLYVLDEAGKRVEGPAAESYVLKKVQ